jgi:serine/threonine-protein kinase
VSAIQFLTLGTLDLRAADGRELHTLLAQPKRIALFAYLCIAQPRGFHHRDTLLGLFWPNADEEHARTSLRKSLHFLRRALGDDAILSRGDEEVAVDFQRVSCDVALFEENLRVNRIEEALEIYRGDLLTGFFIDDAPEFDQWLHSQRTGLRASAARAAYGMSDLLDKAGSTGAAVSWARRSLELADTDERTLRRLVELQCRAGDRTGAIQAYEDFSLYLAAEYESEPSADTRSLIARIRSGWEPTGADTEQKATANRERTGQTTAAHPSVDGVPPALEKKSGDQLGANGKAWIRREGNKLYPALALVILMAGVAIRGWTRPPPPEPEVQYTMIFDSTEAMVRSTPWSGRIAISQDGKLLAYIGGPRSQLLIRPRSQLHPTIAVRGSEGAASPFFSPDGKQVGFLREGIVQIALVSGGPPITVSDSLTGVAGASWGPDNFIYADGSMPSKPASLVRVEAKPGAVPRWFTTLNTAEREVDHSWPDVLPNGKGVLFTVGFIGRNGVKGAASYAIAVADIPSGTHHVILNNAMYARYAKPGYLLYVTTNKALMVVPFNQNSMKIAGEATALTEGMRLGLLGSADLAVSATGTLVYATGAGEGKQELVWVTRDGKEQAVDPDWAAFYMGGPTLSPDGKSIAVARIASVESPASIWIKRLDRGPSIKLTVDTKENGMPAWTADGKSVTYSSTSATGAIELWTQRVDRSAQAVMQRHEKSNLYNARWSPDGKWLIYQTDAESAGSGDILAIRPGIDTVPVPVVATRFTEISPAISPSGRWLAYVSNETGKDEIYVVPFPNPGKAKWAISEGGGTEPVWSHRGRELFYRDASGNLVAVVVNTKPTFSIGSATALFPAAGFSSLRWRPQYSVAPDDRRFLMVRPLKTSTPDKLIFVHNWVEELKSRATK